MRQRDIEELKMNEQTVDGRKAYYEEAAKRTEEKMFRRNGISPETGYKYEYLDDKGKWINVH